MKLRIVGGTLGGRILRFPNRQTSFRPSLERTREAIANAVTDRIAGSRVADICAGSGAVGFEMLSRGAQHASFVDTSRARLQTVQSLAAEFGVEERCSWIHSDCRAFCRRHAGMFDIVYFDPPYQDEALAAALPSVCRCMAPGGICLYEHESRPVRELALPEGYAVRTRTWGRATVECITHTSATQE